MVENPGEFSVVQWLADGQYEYVRRYVDANTAVPIARHYCRSPAAKTGITVRVMIEDGGGNCVFDWQRDKGIVFPTEFLGMYKLGESRA